MKLFKKDPPWGYIFIMSKYLRIFTDCGDWFCYIEILHYQIRFSSAGFLVFDKKKGKYIIK